MAHLRDQLGRLGIWRGASQVTAQLAVDVEQSGFGASRTAAWTRWRPSSAGTWRPARTISSSNCSPSRKRTQHLVTVNWRER
jgi:hypothetical protein